MGATTHAGPQIMYTVRSLDVGTSPQLIYMTTGGPRHGRPEEQCGHAGQEGGKPENVGDSYVSTYTDP